MLSIALAPALGIVGVALGTLIPTIVEAVAVLTPYTLRTLQVRPSRFVRESLVPVLLPVIPTVLAIWAVGRVLAPTSIPALIVTVAIAHAVYLAVYLATGPAAPERRLVGDLIAGWRAR